MFLQRAGGGGRDEGRNMGGGGVYIKRSNFKSSPSSSSSSRDNTSRHGYYACQRSYPPTPLSTTTVEAAGTDFGGDPAASKQQACLASISRSPPKSPATPTFATAGKSSFGVFLQTCQISGDFLQVRVDGAASHTPVRLYLTATELVKKTSVNAPDRDFTISRYALPDVQVSASKVSPTTLVVSVAGNVPSSNGRVSLVGVADDHTTVAPTTRHVSVHADNDGTHSHPLGDEYRSSCNGEDAAQPSSDHPSRRTVVVEAYRLKSETQAAATEGVRQWISNIEKNKQKLELLERLRQSTTTTNTSAAATTVHTVADPTSSESTSVPLPALTSAARSPAIAISTKRQTPPASSSSSPRRNHSKDNGVAFRHSVCDYPSFGSPTREKFPTTTNGRYTPLHHHYSPHLLFSNSHYQQQQQQQHAVVANGSAVQLRQRHKPSGKEPFRILRRLSLGAGSSGSYHFPPSHETSVNNNNKFREDGKHARRKNGNGRTTYMYSLSQDDSLHSPGVPLNTPQSEFSSRHVRDASPRQQTTPTHNGGSTSSSWKQRRSIFSRSISENCDYTRESAGSGEAETSEGANTVVKTPDTSQSQTQYPLPDSVAGCNTETTARGHVSAQVSSAMDNEIPVELRDLQSLLTSITSSQSSPSTPLPPSTFEIDRQASTVSTNHSSPPHTPSDNENDEDNDEEDGAGFQSFLRHKQIRGRKIHVSPRANSSILSSELLSPPLWMDRFSMPPSVSPPNDASNSSTNDSRTGGSSGKVKTGGSSTLPRRHKLKTETSPGSRTSKTLDREGSSSPGPKSSSSKTPKIFKRFHRHRRWQSSSGVRLEEEMVPPPPSTPDDLLQPPLSDLKLSQSSVGTAVMDRLYLLPAREVAEGLTLMDAHLLGRISPDEIRDGAWMKRGQKEKLAPNILAMVQSFNQLALLVPTEVLGEKTPQQRAKVISAYIQIANKCYHLKNFNSLKAILAGLQSTPVFRLRKTWKDIPSKRKKQFNMLCRLMSEEDNWQVYRDELDGCLTSSTPCVPYLGQFLTQVCHQLSYNKMRVEKEEVQLRRRSRSFVGGVNKGEKEAGGDFRRRTSSFHRSSLEVCGGKETSTTSLSTPVSPVVSEDESESSSKNSKGEEEEGGVSRIVAQVGQTGAEQDSQSLEFSLDLDEPELALPMSQPEPTSNVSPDSSEGDTHHNKTLARRKKRPSQKLITNFHSTPVKDANGYIKPLCSPLKLTFDDDLSAPLGYDEPDFDVPSQYEHKDNEPGPFDNEQSESSRGDEENGSSKYRIKIPSISLQKTSSHSSLEDWDEQREKMGQGARLISKSRSLESNLGLGGTGREGNETSDGESRLNRLTPSHSIPSLDSDSVFSIDDEQREGEREEEGEREGQVEGIERNTANGFVRRKLQYHLEDSFERSMESEISTEDTVPTLLAHHPHNQPPPTTTTSTTSTATPSTATQDISREREAIFSPMSSSSEFYTHSRDQSFSTVGSSSVAYDARDTSSSPVETSITEQSSRKHRDAKASPKREGRKKARKRSVHRSKSVTGPGTYRHKWRWKKAIALTSSHNTSTTTSQKPSTTLNNADPFHLLQIYKDRSGDCLTANTTTTTTTTTTTSSSSSGRTDFRVFLNRFNSNSETRNYELSFEREP